MVPPVDDELAARELEALQVGVRAVRDERAEYCATLQSWQVLYGCPPLIVYGVALVGPVDTKSQEPPKKRSIDLIPLMNMIRSTVDDNRSRSVAGVVHHAETRWSGIRPKRS